VPVTRRVILFGGVGLAVVGFALALVSLALPWATYRVSAEVPGQPELNRTGGVAVFQLDSGFWYVVVLFAVLGLLAGAAAASGRSARAAGVAAVLMAVVGMLVTTMLINNIRGASISSLSSALGTFDLRAATGPGTGFGLVALPVLALGAALLSVRTPGRS
jgi:hypothetical protein